MNALLTGFLRDREERRTSHAVHCVLAIEQLDTRDEKKIAMLLKRCHENLGHPSTPRFVGMLKSARATEQCIKIAKGLKCATCDQFQAQKSHHVSKPAPLLHFNDLIAVDTFEVELSCWPCEGYLTPTLEGFRAYVEISLEWIVCSLKGLPIAVVA